MESDYRGRTWVVVESELVEATYNVEKFCGVGEEKWYGMDSEKWV